MRGIFQAAFLRAVGAHLAAPLWSNFDLIAGTSTGALIALAIAHEIPPDRMVDLFESHGPRIFNPRFLSGLLDPFRAGPRFSSAPLRVVLERLFQTRRMADARVPVMIIATNLDRFGHRVFTTLEANGGTSEDGALSVVDVAMASSAAPTYFPAVRPVGEERSYVDGGMWANNPSLVAILSAHAKLGIAFDEMRLVSLGNGEFPSGAIAQRYNQQRPIRSFTTVLDLMFSAQTTAADDFAESLLGAENVIRLNQSLPEVIALDDVERARAMLPPLAEGFARAAGPKLQRFIQGHGPAVPKPRAYGLELLALHQEHRYLNAAGDFEGEITCTVKNVSENPVALLFPDSVSFQGTIPAAAIVLDCRVSGPPAGVVNLVLDQRFTNEIETTKLDGRQRKATRIYWQPKVTPALAPGSVLQYAVVIRTTATEDAAFHGNGSFAGFATKYPTANLGFRCEAPPGYHIDRSIARPYLRTESGDAVAASIPLAARFDDGDRVLRWDVAGDAVKITVNYLVPIRFLRDGGPGAQR